MVLLISTHVKIALCFGAPIPGYALYLHFIFSANIYLASACIRHYSRMAAKTMNKTKTLL